MKRNGRDLLVVLFLVLGIALAVFAYFWFSGRIETGRRQRVLVYFPDVTGLRIGDPVEVLGIPGGRVAALRLEDGRVRGELLVDRDLTLTIDTRFAIRSVSYLGSDRCVMVKLGSGPVAGNDHIFEGVNEALDIEETFLRVDRMMERFDPEELSGELRRAGAEILAAVSYEFDRLNAGVDGLGKGMTGTADGLKTITARIDSLSRVFDESSTAGRLVSSDELYIELRETNESLQALLLDIKQNPRRYFKFSLF